MGGPIAVSMWRHPLYENAGHPSVCADFVTKWHRGSNISCVSEEEAAAAAGCTQNAPTASGEGVR